MWVDASVADFQFDIIFNLNVRLSIVVGRFIAPGAPMEINLSGSVRRATMADMLSFQNQVRSCHTFD